MWTRDIPAPELALWRENGRREVRVSVRRRGAPTWTNLSDTMGGDWVLGVRADIATPDQPASTFDVRFMRRASNAAGASRTLSPGISQDAINRVGAEYRPLLHPGREVQVHARVGSVSTWHPWRLWLAGEVEDAEWPGDEILVRCQTLDGVLLATQIEVEEPRGAPDPGVPIATEIQSLLNDWWPGSDVPTLRVIGSPGFSVGEYRAAPGSLGELVRGLAQRRGWDVRYLWSDADSAYRLTLYLPPRDKTDPDYLLPVDEVLQIPGLAQSRRWVRNAVRVPYVTEVGGEEQAVTVTDPDSIAEYRRRAIVVPLSDNNEMPGTQLQAEALGGYAISDLSRPLVEARYRLTRMVPWLELHDVLAIQADGARFDDDRTFAVVGGSHEITAEDSYTEMDLRGGSPVGQFFGWHEFAGDGAQPTMRAQYASDDQGSNASDTFNPAIHTYARWSQDGGITWTAWFKIVGEDGASAEGRYTDYIFRLSTDPPPTPTGETPVGWFDAPPVYDPAETSLWMSRAERDGATGALLSTWSVPVRLTGAQGPPGSSVEVRYSGPEPGENIASTFNPGLHVFMQVRDSGTSWPVSWARIVGEDGAAGEDGLYFDYRFRLSETQPDTPTGGSPAGWSDAPPPYDPAETSLWMTRAQRDARTGAMLTEWSTPVKLTGDQGPPGPPGVGGIMALLDNDSHVLPANADGVVSTYAGADTTISVYQGATDVSESWNYSASPSAGVTGTLVGRTYTVTGMSQAVDGGHVDITATRSGHPSVTVRFALGKARAGAPGAAGASGTAYWLVANVAAIKRSLSGTYTPAEINVSARSATGATPTDYAGRYVIATSNDGSGWTNRYQSAGDELSTSFAPPAGVVAVRVRLYREGSFSQLLDEEIIPVVEDGPAGQAGVAGLMALLTNDAHTVPTAADGSGGNYAGAVTTAIVYRGTTDDSANWAASASPSAGVTGNLAGKTYTVTGMSADTGYVDITLTRSGYPSLVVRFSLSKAKGGATGAAGVAYMLQTSAAAVKRSLSGDYTPATVTASAKSATGSNFSPYAGRFAVATSTDGENFVTQYSSASNESSYTYTVPPDVLAVRFRLYQAGGFSTLLDEETVPIVEDGPSGQDGAPGPAGTPGLMAVLTNDSHTVPTAADGSGGNYSGASTTAIVYHGTVDVSDDWNCSAAPGPGVTGSLAGKTYTVTGMTGDTGYVDLTLTRTGYATLVVRFSLSKARRGVNARVYAVKTSVAAIKRTRDGVFIPAQLGVSATSTTGDSAPVAYTGRYVIAFSLNGSTFTNGYTSSGDEASASYAPPASAVAVRVRLYAAGSFSTLLDEEVVPIIDDGPEGPAGQDGADGPAGTPGLMALLTNDAHTIPTAADGSGGNYTGAQTTAMVFHGTTNVSDLWAISAAPSAGVTGSLSGKTYTVTAMSADTGYVDFTLTRTGYATLTVRFSLSKARAGSPGAAGAPGVAYMLRTSAAAIKRDRSGTYTPATVTASGRSASGSSWGPYAGRFAIATAAPGGGFVTQYSSSSNESEYTYTIPAGVVAVRFRLYQAGGFSTILDEEIVPVVEDGPAGSPDPRAWLEVTEATQLAVTVQYRGVTGVGGTGPLEWQRIISNFGQTFAWPGSWNTTPLSTTEVVPRQGNYDTTVQFRVRDQEGRISPVATLTIDGYRGGLGSDGLVDDSQPTEGGAYIFRRGQDTLDDVQNSATYRKAGAGYVDTSGRVAAIYDTETGVLRDGGYVGGGASRARTAINSGGQVTTGLTNTALVAGTAAFTVKEMAVKPHQNRLGPWARGPFTTGGAFWDSNTLEEMNLAVGDVISISLTIARASGNGAPRWRVDFVGTAVQEQLQSHTDAPTRMALENYTIPAGTTAIRLVGIVPTGGGTTTLSRAMLNVGPVALAYEDPPLRGGRETFADLDADASGRVYTTILGPRQLAPQTVIREPSVALNISRGLKAGEVADAQAVEFSPAFDTTPVVLFGMGGITYHKDLDPTASHAVNVRALDLDADGFTARARIQEVGGTEYREATFTGSDANKSHAPEAYNSVYRFLYSVEVLPRVDIGGASPEDSTITLGFWTNDGAGWVMRAYRTYVNPTDGTLNFAGQSIDVAVSGMGLNDDFRISVEGTGGAGGSVNRDKVTWYEGTVPADATMTPTAEGAPLIPFLALTGA